MRAFFAIAVLALALAGCAAKSDATVDGVLLAQADGFEEAPEGATLAVKKETADAAVVPAGAKVVRLAVGRDVLWSQLQALMKKVEAAGARPVLLVGDWHKVKAFRLDDEWRGGNAITVISYIDGKACVQPPGAIQAKCVQSGTKEYIERAYVRELVREQVRQYSVEQVEVELPSSLPWADVVRTIDGARTCCKGTTVRVRLKPAQTVPG